MRQRIGLLRGLGRFSLADLSGVWGDGVAPGVSLIASGSSMRPLIRAGDELTVVAAERIALGDIVVFRRGAELLCHRVKELHPDGSIVTRGDNVDEPDAPVRREDILGKLGGIRRRPFVLSRAAMRAAALGVLRGIKALPGARKALSTVIPGLCRYDLASPAGLTSMAAYTFVEAGPGSLTGLKPGSVLVARLCGRVVASLFLDSGTLEVHEAVVDLGLEPRLRELACALIER